jgi:hypothetical protein
MLSRDVFLRNIDSPGLARRPLRELLLTGGLSSGGEAEAFDFRTMVASDENLGVGQSPTNSSYAHTPARNLL